MTSRHRQCPVWVSHTHTVPSEAPVATRGAAAVPSFSSSSLPLPPCAGGSTHAAWVVAPWPWPLHAMACAPRSGVNAAARGDVCNPSPPPPRTARAWLTCPELCGRLWAAHAPGRRRGCALERCVAAGESRSTRHVGWRLLSATASLRSRADSAAATRHFHSTGADVAWCPPWARESPRGSAAGPHKLLLRCLLPPRPARWRASCLAPRWWSTAGSRRRWMAATQGGS